MKNSFLVQHFDVAGEDVGKPRTDWLMTIIAYLIIGVFIALMVLVATNRNVQQPFTEEQHQDRLESDPRW